MVLAVYCPPHAPTLGHAAGVAREIQCEIDRRFGLGASIGVGPNKLVAKMASGVEKPRGWARMPITPETTYRPPPTIE
jgi:DNA polymerase-4